MSPPGFSEDALVEHPAMELFAVGLGNVNAYTEVLGPSGTLGRDSQHDAFLTHRLRDAIAVLNPDVPEHVRDEALDEITKDRSLMLPVHANQEIHELVRDSYRAQWGDSQGETRYAVVRFIDLHDSTKNDWLATNQVWMKGSMHRRPDAVLYVNGIPLVLLEFKGSTVSVDHGYRDNITDYRDTIPQLFHPNGFIIVSNGSQAKLGATYAPWDYFGDWKLIDTDGNRGYSSRNSDPWHMHQGLSA